MILRSPILLGSYESESAVHPDGLGAAIEAAEELTRAVALAGMELCDALESVADLSIALPSALEGRLRSAKRRLWTAASRGLIGAPRCGHGPFFASPNPKRHLFHRLGCEWLEYIGCPLQFDTHEGAVEAGYRPCKTCRA